MAAKLTTRRAFLGSTALVVGALSVSANLDRLCAHADEAGEVAPAENGVRLGFWIDTKQCVGCGDCVEACVKANGTPESLRPRRDVRTYLTGFGEKLHISTSCMHCADAACEKVCPAHAILKRVDGIVAVDKSRCMGCKYCYQACPFEVPQYNNEGMDKCDCCLGAGVAPGDTPHCVAACSKGALHFGDITRMLEQAGGDAQLIAAPTSPSCLIS